MIKICSYLEDKYIEEMKKIIMDRDPNLHYDIDLEYLFVIHIYSLLEFLYYFPFEGSRFHDYPKEFLKFIKKCFIAVQSKLIT